MLWQITSVLYHACRAYDRYAYVNNNPINFNDPSGHRPCDDGNLDGRCDNLPGGGGGRGGTGNGGGIINSSSSSQLPIIDKYLQGWELAGTAWSIFNNPDAGIGGWAVSGGYLVAWVGAHASLAVGIGGLVCVASGPGCVASVEAALGIGSATTIEAEGYLSNTPRVGTTVYRVWGSDPTTPEVNGSFAWGHSWTPINPATVQNYREIAGLPSGGASGAFNSARFVSEGIIMDPTGISVRSALSLDGLTGNLIEYVIPNPEIQIQLINIAGVNPPY